MRSIKSKTNSRVSRKEVKSWVKCKQTERGREGKKSTSGEVEERTRRTMRELSLHGQEEERWHQTYVCVRGKEKSVSLFFCSLAVVNMAEGRLRERRKTLKQIEIWGGRQVEQRRRKEMMKERWRESTFKRKQKTKQEDNKEER